jgi:hypothetical protein
MGFAFCFPPPTRSMVSTEKWLMPVFSSRGKFNVDGAEHREDKCLQQADQQFEKVKWKRKKHRSKESQPEGQPRPDGLHRVQQGLARVDIAK